MPKLAIRTEDRIRIELEYDDYKMWENIFGDSAVEHTTLADPDNPDTSGWWKTLYVKVGKTEYRFAGPLMRSRED